MAKQDQVVPETRGLAETTAEAGQGFIGHGTGIRYLVAAQEGDGDTIALSEDAITAGVTSLSPTSRSKLFGVTRRSLNAARDRLLGAATSDPLGRQTIEVSDDGTPVHRIFDPSTGLTLPRGSAPGSPINRPRETVRQQTYAGGTGDDARKIVTTVREYDESGVLLRETITESVEETG